MSAPDSKATRLSIFPLPGALLFPGLHLPLHIFEPRYRALVGDAMARDRRIGMIQPRPMATRDGDKVPLFDVGCVGRIADVEALDDGRYNLVLKGVSLFRVVRELDVTTAFRQVEAELLPVEPDQALSIARRSSLETESRAFADAQGYAVDWDQVGRLDDESLVNGIAQIAPFDAAAKQALLEASDLEARAELIIQLMQFFGRHDGENAALRPASGRARVRRRPPRLSDPRRHAGHAGRGGPPAVTDTILIGSRPAGEAPDWVRDAWIGLTLPTLKTRPVTVRTVGVVTGPRSLLRSVWALLKPAGQRTTGYLVRVQPAIAVLEAKSPEAAASCRTSAPHLVTRRGVFSFDETCVLSVQGER